MMDARAGAAAPARTAVAVAAFTDAFGTGLVIPLSVLFFTLTTDVGLAEIGLVASAASLVALPFGLLGGTIVDRLGSRFAMVSNNLLSAAGFVLYLMVNDILTMFFALLLVGLGDRIYWSAWTSYIRDLSSVDGYEQLFSKLESLKMAAMGCASVIATVVLAAGALTGSRTLVVINIAVTVVAGVIYALASGAAADPPAQNATKRCAPTEWREWRAVIGMSGFWQVLVGQFFLGPLSIFPSVALVVYLVEQWDMNPAVGTALFGVSTGTVALALPRVNALMRRARRSTAIGAGCLGIVVVLVVLTVVPVLPQVAAWTFACALGVAIAFATMLYVPPTNAILATATAPSVRGRFVAAGQTASALGIAIYPAFLGLLDGPAWQLWVVTAICAIVGGAGYATALRVLPPELNSAGRGVALGPG